MRLLACGVAVIHTASAAALLRSPCTAMRTQFDDFHLGTSFRRACHLALQVLAIALGAHVNSLLPGLVERIRILQHSVSAIPAVPRHCQRPTVGSLSHIKSAHTFESHTRGMPRREKRSESRLTSSPPPVGGEGRGRYRGVIFRQEYSLTHSLTGRALTVASEFPPSPRTTLGTGLAY